MDRSCLPVKVNNAMENELLSKHTTFGIGGPAELWAEPDSCAELKKLVLFASKNKKKYFVIGAGSNILADDKGYNGLVISLSKPCFKKIMRKGNYIRAGAGVRLSQLISFASKNRLGGIEGLTGIPGTVGGGLYMNAGYKTTIGDVTAKVRVMDKNGNMKTILKRDLKFGYRSSNLKKYIIIEGIFKLPGKDMENIDKLRKEAISHKMRTQPLNERSAGCVFKNPKGVRPAAGQLIDECGLKGRISGGAAISEKHANFIINKNKASSKDVISLIELIRKTVKQKKRIELKTEIKFL